MIRTLIITFLFTGLTLTSTQAQLFKRLANRVQDKIEQKVEDKVVEEISEEIANRAMRPINKAFDDMFREQYKQTYGEEYDDSAYAEDPEGRSAAMQAMMSSMFGNVDLPEKFEFDYSIEIETYDYGSKKANTVTMLISTTSDAFGMEQSDGQNESIIVFEGSADKMVLFNKKDKTVMAMSGMMGMASVMAKQQIDENVKKVEVEKTSKTKDILGYKSVKYKVTSEEDEGEIYLSNELPFDWKDSFGSFIEKLSPQFYQEHPEYNLSGMMLEAKSKRKSDKKESKWITKNISNKGTTIVTADYKNALQVD